MVARKFGRIVNITSGAVKAPIPELGLSNGARTGLTGFVAGLARQTVRAQRHHQRPAARAVRDRPPALEPGVQRQDSRENRRRAAQGARRRESRRAASAPSRSSATPAPICAAPRRATSPARTCCSTAGRIQEPSEEEADDPVHDCSSRRCCSPAPSLAQAYPNRPVKVDRALAAGAGDRHRRARRRREAAGRARPAVRHREPARRRRPDRHRTRWRRARPTATRCSPPRAARLSIMPNLQKTPYDPLKDFAPVSLICRDAVRAGRASVVPGEQREGVHRAGEGESRQVHLLVLGHRRDRAPLRRAVQLDGADRGAPRSLQGQRAGAHRRHRTARSTYTIETVAATASYIKSGTPQDLRRLHRAAHRRAARRAAARRGCRHSRLRRRRLDRLCRARRHAARDAARASSAEMQKALRHRRDEAAHDQRSASMPVSSTPDEMAAFLQREQERYGTIIRNANIKIDQQLVKGTARALRTVLCFPRP